MKINLQTLNCSDDPCRRSSSNGSFPCTILLSDSPSTLHALGRPQLHTVSFLVLYHELKEIRFLNFVICFIHLFCVWVREQGRGGCVCHAEAGGQLAGVTSLHLPCGSRNSTQAVKFRGRHLYPLSHVADPRRIDFFSFKNIVGITNTGCNKHNPS